MYFRFIFAYYIFTLHVEVFMDISCLFAYSWRRHRREGFASPIRDPLPYTRLHHAKFLGTRNHFTAFISAVTSSSAAGVDRPSLSGCDAHSIRALPGSDAHCNSSLFCDTSGFLG